MAVDLQRIVCDLLAVEFRGQGDRIAHAVLARRDEADPWHKILTSIEGAADDPWPPSPALQELHIEPRDARDVALLVGRAGGSHWSASFEFDARGRLHVDVACRIASRPLRLGSEYQMPSPLEFNSWELAVGPPALLAGDAGGERIAVRPAIPDGPWPGTIRWQYTIGMLKAEW